MASERIIDVERLLALAADRSQDSRAELMTAIVDLFLPAEDRLTDQQRALITDVLGKLVSGIEIEMRQHLVEALMRSRIELPQLEAMLANDAIEVARPILERSRVIRDADLIAVVMQRAEEHRMAVAVRRNLSTDVADALVDNAEPDVVEALIRNTDAAISRRAMEYLVSESKRYDRFQEPLLTRNDLPSELAWRMYWWVSAALRTHILRAFDISAANLDGLIEGAARRTAADHEDGQTAQARAMRLAKRLQELGELSDHFLLQALRQGRISLFVAGLAARAGVDFTTAWRIVTDRGCESLLVLARAIGLPREITTSMVLILDNLQSSGAPRAPAVVSEILQLYDEIPAERAAKVLAFWQLDRGFQDAISAIEAPAGPGARP